MDGSVVQFLSVLASSFVLLFGESSGQIQYQSYPGQHLTQQSESLTCNDLQCKVDECCIETYRSAQCVALVTIASGQAFCTRLKKCYRNSDCPTVAPCCVQALDSTFAKTNLKAQSYYDSVNALSNGNMYGNSYGSIYGNSYGNSYGSSYSSYFLGKPNDISTESLNLKEGYCLAAARDNGQRELNLVIFTCFRSVSGAGSGTANCPCASSSNVCKLFLDPFPFGTCTLLSDITS